MPTSRSLKLSLSIAALLAVASLTRFPSNMQTPVSGSLFSEVPVPPPVEATLRAACMDCHSNETHWPWYVHLPISSYLLVHDVERGREHLNFSDWQRLKESGPEQVAAGFSGICENLLSGAMPKPYYLWMHPQARVTKAQISEVCSWAERQQMEALRQSVSSGGAGK